MGLKDLNAIADVSREFSPEETLEMFRRMSRIRNFELNAKAAYDKGLMKIPIYLSIGQEAIAAALSMTYEKPAIFAQHRAHDLYIAFGGDLSALADELLGLSTGCAQGMGGSASIHSPATLMFGHSGLMGDQIPISVGYALGTGKDTLAVMGDASGEEDYVAGAMGYASTKKLPMIFVCSDNGLSILTKVAVRRSWKMADLANAYGMEAVDIADDPWLIMHHVRLLKGKRPAFMNIHTARDVWHAGTGNDGDAEWNRFALVKEELSRLGLADDAARIEEEAAREMAALWEKRLENFAAVSAIH